MLGDRDFVTADDIEQLQYMEQVCLKNVRTCICTGVSVYVQCTGVPV